MLVLRVGDMDGTGVFTDIMRVVTALGSVVVRWLLALAAAGALWAMTRRRDAIVLIGTVAAGWGANSLVKAMVFRPRPDIVDHLVSASGPSFPSGHSFNSAVVFVAIALAFASLAASDNRRLLMLLGALGLSALVAFSRVWLGVHWPSDVLAGWMGGVGWALAAHALMRRGAKTG